MCTVSQATKRSKQMGPRQRYRSQLKQASTDDIWDTVGIKMNNEAADCNINYKMKT